MNKIEKKLLDVTNKIIEEKNQRKKQLFLAENFDLQIDQTAVSFEKKEIENHLYFLELIKNRLESFGQETSLFHLFDYFSRLGEVMDLAGLSEYEKGHIFNKFLTSNFCILDTQPYSFIRLKDYQEELKAMGIKDQASFEEVYIQYLAKRNTSSKKSIVDVIIENIMVNEEKNRLFLVEQYKAIKGFMEKEDKTVEDYTLVSNVLKKLGVPDNLSSYYLNYHKIVQQKSKKEISSKITLAKKEVNEKVATPETSLSRKQLKIQLAQLYDEKEQTSFDYVHFIKVLKLLKYLNYSDEVKERLLNGMFQASIKNYSFYHYLFQKIAYSGKYPNTVEELKEIFSSMFICSPEEYEFYKTYALELLDGLSILAIENFDYEMQLMKKF